jgi:hypothetical protein
MAVAVLNPSVDPARRQRYLLATSGALIVVGLAAGTLASGARMADVLLVAAVESVRRSGYRSWPSPF